MKRVFFIHGPVSSGNRLVGAILVRAGCWGEGSTNQPKTAAEIPQDVKDIVWIHPGPADRMPAVIQGLKDVGFDEFVMVVVIREPEANCRLMIDHGFKVTLEEAYDRRNAKIISILNAGVATGCKIEIITYEGLSKPMLKLWLTRLGLRADNLDAPLNLAGQCASTFIANENCKHYGDLDAGTPGRRE